MSENIDAKAAADWDQKSEKLPTTYVVKRGLPVEKFVGYVKEKEYDADERLNICNCIGFINKGHCKHLEFKSYLKEFGVEELVYFGEHPIGDCKPKNEDQIGKIMLDIYEVLFKHFKFEDLDVKRYVPLPSNNELFTCIDFVGKRKKNTLIIGYTRGIMFRIDPVNHPTPKGGGF